MVPKDAQWITDPAERIQPGDLYRVREDSHSEYCEWQSADHYAGTEAGYFAAWHSRDIQFCRPARPAAQPAPGQEWEPLPIEEDTMTVPGRDQARYRQHGAEWSEWQDTHGDPALLTAYMQQKPPEFEWEWRRRKVTKAKSETERISAQDWGPVIDPNHILRAQRDQVRTKEAGQWSEWRHPPFGEGLTIAQYFAGPGEWECRTLRGSVSQQPQRPAPEQPPAATPDRGNKYHRTITQTLPGDTHGLALTIDVYDVLQAFGVTCPATQHAVKKLLCAGLRGSKSAEQDISEAASSCRRAIELLEFEL